VPISKKSTASSRTRKIAAPAAVFDTNVVLDLLLAREPFDEMAEQAILLVEEGRVSGILCATTLTTIEYFLRKLHGAAETRRQLGKLLSLFRVGAVDQRVIEAALQSRYSDFEDGVLIECARISQADMIVTRDKKGFQHAPMAVQTPMEFIRQFDSID